MLKNNFSCGKQIAAGGQSAYVDNKKCQRQALAGRRTVTLVVVVIEKVTRNVVKEEERKGGGIVKMRDESN